MKYGSVHMRLRRQIGPAKDFTCKCGSPAREWAYVPSPNEIVDELGRKYSLALEDYQPMCKPCHQRFDTARITHCPRGHEYAGWNLLIDTGKRKCRTCVYERNRNRPLSESSKQKAAEAQRRRRAARRAA